MSQTLASVTAALVGGRLLWPVPLIAARIRMTVLVAQDPDVIGTTAATMLFARVSGDVTPPRELILRTRFISRGSVEISLR